MIDSGPHASELDSVISGAALLRRITSQRASKALRPAPAALQASRRCCWTISALGAGSTSSEPVPLRHPESGRCMCGLLITTGVATAFHGVCVSPSTRAQPIADQRTVPPAAKQSLCAAAHGPPLSHLRLAPSPALQAAVLAAVRAPRVPALEPRHAGRSSDFSLVAKVAAA